MTVKSVQGYRCDECDHVDVDAIENPLYECSNCGTRWSRDNASEQPAHKCPDCKRFGSRIADFACPECDSGEMEESEIWIVDGEGGQAYATEEDARENDDAEEDSNVE